MDYRTLGASGLNVPVMGLGTANFRGGSSPATGLGDKAVARLVDVALERDAAFFDTADIYGAAEEVLGKALGKRRSSAMIATKAGLRSGPGPNDTGATRHHLIGSCEASLRRLGTDYIDLFLLHSFDGRTPVEETLSALETLVHAGKVRAIGASNHAGWQLMKALGVSDHRGWPRFCAHQIAWSLAMRDAEWDLAPLAADQNVATLVWGPLAGGALTGRYGRKGEPFARSRYAGFALGLTGDEQLQHVVDCLTEIGREAGLTQSQVALAWLLQRPTVASVLVGASSAEQLESNLDAIPANLSGDQIARLDDVSAQRAPYPHGLQLGPGSERIARPASGGNNIRVDRALGVAGTAP